MKHSLEAIGVSLELGGTQILKDVQFSVEQGSTAVLLGPSGVGKSSLLKVLAGLLQPNQGEVRLRDAQGLRMGVKIQSGSAWMAQQDLLLPWATVLRNAIPPMSRSKAEQALMNSEARRLLHSLGLAGWETRLPCELSQGMRQRVALVRTLMMNRPYLLLDEPCSALDSQSRQAVLELLVHKCRNHGCGLVMVSHHGHDAEALEAKIWRLEGGRLCPA